MVCNNSTIKYVLSWTLACNVSGQEQLPFQTGKEKRSKYLSLIISRVDWMLAVGTKLWWKPSVTQRRVTGFLCSASSQLRDSDSVQELFGSCVNSCLL